MGLNFNLTVDYFNERLVMKKDPFYWLWDSQTIQLKSFTIQHNKKSFLLPLQEIEDYSFVTQLAGLTDHLSVAMRLAVSTGEEEP